jgi:hypothetical protein
MHRPFRHGLGQQKRNEGAPETEEGSQNDEPQITRRVQVPPKKDRKHAQKNGERGDDQKVRDDEQQNSFAGLHLHSLRL